MVTADQVEGMSSMPLSGDDYNHIMVQSMIHSQAQSLQGKPPRVHFSREELIESLARRTLEDEGCLFSATPHDVTEYKQDPYPPSIFSMKDIKEAKLEKLKTTDLKVETHHRGGMLLLRTISTARRLGSISTVVEDEFGGTTQLQVFGLGRKVEATKLFPQGQILIVKEPYFRFSSTAVPSIRVDHLSDMMLLEADDELVPEQWKVEKMSLSGQLWKELGNQAMKKGETREAIKWYSRGLLQAEGDKELTMALHLNRCLAYLKMEDSELALRDAESVLSVDPINEKALYRKAKALYQLRKFAQSGNAFQKLIKQYPENDMVKEETKIVRQRVLEELKGIYDFRKMLTLAKSGAQSSDYDFADYSYSVYPARSVTSGNGLFARAFIKAGDLIYCGKAFVNCRGKDNGISMTVDPVTKQVGHSTGAFLGSAVLARLRRQPSYLPELLKLHTDFDRGTFDPDEKVDMDHPVIDSFLVNNITRLNSFSSTDYFDEFPEMRVEDLSQIQRNVKTKENPFDPNCGLWILPSYMNHSCVPNAHRVIIGDMMVIRAIVDIPKDAEIFISYTDLKLDHQSKKDMFKLSWGFQCSCKACEFEEGLTPAKKLYKMSLLNQISAIITDIGYERATKHQASEFHEMVEELSSIYTYPTTVVPRPYLGEALIRLYSMYNDIGDAQAAYRALHLAPRAYGAMFQVTERGVRIDKLGHVEGDLVRAYVRLATVTRAVGGAIPLGWKAAAKMAYKIVMGEDVTFEETFGECIGEIAPVSSL